MENTHRPEPAGAQAGRPQELELENAGFITELFGLSSFLEHQTHLERSLRDLAVMAAQLLQVNNCSIMLLKDDPDQPSGPRLRVATHHGHLPEAAYRESVGLNEGIAGQVASSGRPLLIEDIRRSDFAAKARRNAPAGGFVSVPIPAGDHVIGVLNISEPTDGRALGQRDLALTTIVALVVGRSIQVNQLQHLLRSNFIQLALARETRDTPLGTLNEITRNGGRMAKVLAKTFFREMRDAGFGTDHILSAATEIISLLSADLDNRRQEEGRD